VGGGVLVSGRASRNKGAAGEREVCKILREHGYEAKRGWQSRGGGKEEPDVVTTLPGFHLEIKRTERTNIWAAMRQAESDCGEDTMPLVVTRKSREPWLCVLHFDDLLKLLKEDTDA